MSTMQTIQMWLQPLAWIAAIFFGLWLLRRSRTKIGFPACGRCGYDLTGLQDANSICPECGSHVKAVGITPPGTIKRNRWTQGIGLIVLLPTVIFPALLIGLALVFLLIITALGGWR